MKDLMVSARARGKSDEPSLPTIAIMKQAVITALLDGPESLAAIDGAIVYLGDDEEFILLAAIPAILRREYLSTYPSTARLIRSRLRLASREDWQAWVSSRVPAWERRT